MYILERGRHTDHPLNPAWACVCVCVCVCVCEYLNEVTMNGRESGWGGRVLFNDLEEYWYAQHWLLLQAQHLSKLVDKLTNCTII